ncbi:aspartate aminotransferase, putative [Eimeria tenella]|uniref:Aspartate aminotransferase n=1 Tax=Eimeria tenella TaxID=5802 RepID=U6KUU0_EIMTE|nr:aspartate aminotransferase, putative [Eimeria tenella]CDJ39270.1 aspartate aminotransferase, putative [Eimeria tenella]|eukprot:XP_013230025.1 aspartate aminotransferase, putative [Eimeria tenella]
MSLFAAVPLAPPDPILGLAQAFKEDQNPKKVDLGVGAYRTEDGKPYVFKAVRMAEEQIMSDPTVNKEYLPIDGLPELKELTQKLLFGEDLAAAAAGRIVSLQTLSGTGALRLAGEFIRHFVPTARYVYLSKPTWSNHHNVFGPGAGLTIREYPYWDPVTRGVDFEGMIKTLEEAPENSVVVLHVCAHNPTGMDLSHDQWSRVAGVCGSRKLLAVLDCAYQGFGSGELEKDVFGVRLFCKSVKLPFFVAQSFAKNLGLYGERAGALHAVCGGPLEGPPVLSQLKALARRAYSSPPLHGALVLARVLGGGPLRTQWEKELSAISQRIKNMRQLLRNKLEGKQTPGNWKHITQQVGMFSFTGLTPEQCELLTSKWHIYLLKNGRISMAGVNHSNVDYIVTAIDDVIRAAPAP